MNFKKWGLQLKLSVPIAIISTLILGIYGFYSYQTKKTQLTKELNTKLTGTMEKLKKSLVQPFLDMEDEVIKGILVGELKQENVFIGFKVLSEDKSEENYSMGKDSIGATEIVDSEWKIIQNLGQLFDSEELIIKPEDEDVGEPEETLGYIKVFYTHFYILEQLKKELLIVGFVIFLIDFFLFISIFILLKKLAIRPLEKIAVYADSLDLNSLSEKDLVIDRVGPEDEFNGLANIFNGMKRNLKDAHIALKNYADNLENTVVERTEKLRESLNESQGMLSRIEKAIFRVNSQGIILDPVSNYSYIMFEKEIVGEHALKLLFFHFKDGSVEKKELIGSFKGMFGSDSNDYIFFESGLPKKVTQPDKKRSQGRVLNIQYIPLYDNKSRLVKLMFIVDDITELEQDLKNLQDTQSKYDIMNDILSFKEKDILSVHLSKSIMWSIRTLGKVVNYELGSQELDIVFNNVNVLVVYLESNTSTELSMVHKLVNELLWGIESLEVDNKYSSKREKVIIEMVIDDLNKLIIDMINYSDGLNELCNYDVGSGLKFDIPEGFEITMKDKVADLKRVMVNLLEYVFLVRNVEDLDEEKISNAPKKARLYAEFDDIITLIRNRSRLIAFYFKILGDHQKFNNYRDLSDLLKQMPSKDKLTEAALVNHLIVPYKKTIKP